MTPAASAAKPWCSSRVDAAIVIFNILLIGALWYAVMEIIHVDRRNTIAAAVKSNDMLVVSLEQYAHRTIEGIDSILKRIIREHNRNAEQFDVRSLLADAPTGDQIISGVTLTDPHGNVIIALGIQQPAVPANIAARDHFRTLAAKDDSAVYVGKPVPDLVSGQLLVPVARRMVSPAGEFAGIVTALVDHRRFTDLFEDASLNRLNTVSLIGLDGITRARLRGNKASAGEDISKSPLFAEQARNPAGNYQARGQLDGIKRYFSYRTIPEHRLIATVGTAEEDVLAEFHPRRHTFLLASALASALIAGITVLLLQFLAAQRRSAVERIRHQSRFLATFDQAAVGIVHADLSGRFIEANQKFCDMLGYTRTELLNMTALQVTHPEDAAASLKFRQQLIEAPGAARNPQSEKRYLHRNGSVIWCLRTASVVRDEDGTPDYLVSVILDITDRKAAEDALRAYAEQMRHLSRRLSEVEENERRNIHRELHDQIGANLSVLNLDLGMIMDLLPGDAQQPAVRRLLQAQQLTAATSARIRDIMGNLRPPALDDFGLLAALRSHAEPYAERVGLEITVTGDDLEPRLPAALETALFRIAQEALTNVSKHAEADKVEIILQDSAGVVTLTITDNGKGFSTTPDGRPRGWGLKTMRERAESIGAAISITPGPAGGTRIVVTVQRAQP